MGLFGASAGADSRKEVAAEMWGSLHGRFLIAADSDQRLAYGAVAALIFHLPHNLGVSSASLGTSAVMAVDLLDQ